MKPLFLVVVVVAGLAGSSGAAALPPFEARATTPAFHDDLSPFGEWFWRDDHGWVWSPSVDVGWRPYSVGHWAWTAEFGWLWVSAEPFGWATFHYGRWLWLDDAGWVWVPGRVWGPAWVDWRVGPGFIGWAPLGPEAVWIPGRGLIAVDVEPVFGPWGWVFVDETRFLAPNLVVVCVPRARNRQLMPSTRVVHRREREERERIVNDAVDHDAVERVLGRPVVSHRVVDAQLRGPIPDDAIRVRHARSIEHERARGDLIGPVPRARDRDLELRPLRGSPDDKQRDQAREQVRERARRERAPAPARPTVPLQTARPCEQTHSCDDIDDADGREREARRQKMQVPRTVKKVPARRPSPRRR